MSAMSDAIKKQIARAEALLAKAGGVSAQCVDMDHFLPQHNRWLPNEAVQIIKTLQVLPADGEKCLLDRYVRLVDQLDAVLGSAPLRGYANTFVAIEAGIHRRVLVNTLRHMAIIAGTCAGMNLPASVALPIAAIAIVSAAMSGMSLSKKRPGRGMLLGSAGAILAFIIGLTLAPTELYRGGMAFLWLYSMAIAAATLVGYVLDSRSKGVPARVIDVDVDVHKAKVVGNFLDPVTGEYRSVNSGGHIDLGP